MTLPPEPATPAPGGRDYGPVVKIDILGAAHEPFAAQPTLRFELSVSEPTDRPIYAISLKAQINFDPARREYDASTREELIELFGVPERWPSTTRSFLWCHSSTVVHSFTGATTFGLEVPCTADLEVTASKYVAALPDGDVPITMHFTGRVLYQGPNRQVQAVHLPWSTTASYRMPVSVWRNMMKHHHGNSGFVLLHEDTIAALKKHKRVNGLHSFDAVVLDLLERAPAADSEGAIG
ncbi:MAG TPA: DUF6084 family protein [Solirubrobacteraceae bacterium]|nr:DUF6084 family protein [Solirubrobacteraceae bacterium]